VGLVYQLFLRSQAPKNCGQKNPSPAELLFPSYLGNKQHGESETKKEVGIQVEGDVHCGDILSAFSKVSTENQEILSSVLSHLVEGFGIPFTVELKGLPSDGLGHGFQCGVDRLEGGETVSVEDGVIDVGQVTVEVFSDGEACWNWLRVIVEIDYTRGWGKSTAFFRNLELTQLHHT